MRLAMKGTMTYMKFVIASNAALALIRIPILNILFLSTENPFPVDHGHHLRTYHVLKALADVHTVHFIGFTQDNSGFKHKPKLQEFCESVEIFQLKYRGWRQALLSVSNLFSPLPLIAQKYYDKQVANRIKELIDSAEIDLVHFDLLHLAQYRKELDGFPSILVNHNVESLRVLRWSKVERNPFLKIFLLYQYRKLKSFEKTVCSEFDRCTVVSDTDKEFLVKLCGSRNFVTIPNGVDVDYFHASKDEVEAEANTLVWAGSMSDPYNKDAVIYFVQQIWPNIRNEIPDARVTFVGNSPPKLLKRMASQSTNVKCTGYVDDVRPHIAKSAIFIAPLRSGSGTKIKVLNAMSQGKLVVTTSVGAEGIEAKPDKEIIIADDPKKFAKKTVYFLKHLEEAQEIGKGARRVIEEKYDWKVINVKIQQVYREFEKEDSLENQPAAV